ncbi:MAG TPA: magnesium transporter [bacterium]|nr:magnesium transporter [bacterium]HPQ65990.1 magnesium transporter [bacterium]
MRARVYFDELCQGRVLALYHSGRTLEAAQVLRQARAEDIADWLSTLAREERFGIFSLLDRDLQGDVLEDSSPSLEAELVDRLGPPELGDILETMPPEEAVEIISEMEPHEEAQVLGEISGDGSSEIRTLLAYPENSAGRIMDADLIALPADLSVKQAIQVIRRSTIEEALYSVFVVDREGRLLGLVPLQKLLAAPDGALLGEVMLEAFARVTPATDQEQAAAIIRKYDLAVLPVVDETGKLLGRITADDAVEIIDEEASEDILRMAGTDDEELRATSSLRIARIRLPWLLICIGGSFLSSLVIRSFEVTLEQVIALVAFIPMITATGGNVGLQSSSIVIRGLALGTLKSSRVFAEVFKQLKVAVLLGISCGVILAGLAFLLQAGQGNGWFMGGVVGLAMFLAVTFSTLSGVLVPLTFSRLRIDPAIASGPLITTMNDVLGIAIYLGSATAMIRVFLH